MFHAETKYRCSVIIADLFLFSVEANALSNVAITVKTEDVERHFEADSLGIAMEAWGLFLVQLISRDDALMLGWDVPSNISC